MQASGRPRRLWLSVALLGLVGAALGAGALALLVAAPMAGLVFGSILLFLAAILGLLALAAFVGVGGILHGSPRGWWTAVAAHALLALGLLALLADQVSQSGGADRFLPGGVALGLVLASAGLLATPDARDWHGV